ncbi:MAG: DUF971 domain-containing protein [Calditrichaeota bacterium]|nr:MAG: DUF971 domain-containing protein [Calditrichota bacterium]MBL1206123.1 DUF971 domain-containing protein [Calditrichota bacterium]NOG45948.1 DUF971 domain-containing protein [Calditrichota bacterium]
MIPKSVEQISDQAIAIKWDDESESVFFAEKVRGQCPCATCKDEEKPKENPFKILKANPNNVFFRNWEMIGRYAIRFSFSDGHNAGIYTFEHLKEIGE